MTLSGHLASSSAASLSTYSLLAGNNQRRAYLGVCGWKWNKIIININVYFAAHKASVSSVIINPILALLKKYFMN